MLRVFKANCNAVVPLETARQCFIFVKFENLFSNIFTNFPVDDIHPVFIHSFRYLNSFPSKIGLAKEIFVLSVT